jgi:thermitase
MKYWAILFLLLSAFASAKNVHKVLKVAVVDSGLDITDTRFKHLCPKGHKDFTGLGIKDTTPHGSHVVGLIEKYSGNGNYCILIYKYFDESLSGFYTSKYEILAIKEAIKNGAKIINISGGGDTFNEDEYLVIKSHPQVLFVVAAGNENKDIDQTSGYFYPASLHLMNIIVVGNLNNNSTKAESSNWADRPISWEMGENVKSTFPNGQYGILSGTSMSTAIHTGKIIRGLLTNGY